MKSPWQKLTDDLLANPDFAEVAEINGNDVNVISTSLEFAENYSEYGLEQSESFFLRADVRTVVHRGDPVIFRGTQYKVLSYQIASDNTSKNIYLKNRNA